MILREILFRWINESIGVRLDFSASQEILNLSKRYNSSERSVSVTICGEWDLIKVGNEFRLNHRSRNNQYAEVEQFQLSVGGVNCNITHSPTIKVFPITEDTKSELVHEIHLYLPCTLFTDNVSFHFRYPMLSDKIPCENGRFLKLNEFFRCRNIPVHLRDRVPVLVLKTSLQDHIMAVFLPNTTTIMTNMSSHVKISKSNSSVVLSFALFNTLA